MTRAQPPSPRSARSPAQSPAPAPGQPSAQPLAVPARSAATEADLLRAIHADPDDTAAYAVYADHLLQRGDLRGELIQLELRLESFAPSDPARRPLDRRATELRRQLRPAWITRGTRWGFRRGFLDWMELPAATFRARLSVAASAADDLAHLRRLTLRSRGETSVFADPPPAFTESDLAAVLAIPTLRRLEHLALYAQSFGPAAGALLARAPLPRLRSLVLDMSPLGDAGVAAFVEAAPTLPALETLGLSAMRLTDEAALSLASWPHLADLRRLDLSSTDIYDPIRNVFTDRGAIALVSSPLAANLESLDLGDGDRLTNATAFALASAHFPRLSTLSLTFSALDNLGATALAASRGLPSLSDLDIGHTRVTDAGLAALLRLPQLTTLRLSGLTLTPAGLQSLVDAPRHLISVHGQLPGADLPDSLRSAFLLRYGHHVEFF